MMYRIFLRRTLLGMALFMSAAIASAQAFPSKPIRILVGFAPGGGADLIARLYADQLSKTLGTPVIVENKPGAYERLAYQALAAAPADGYTLLLTSQGSLMMPGIRPDWPYNIRNLTHVAKVGEAEAVFVVKKGFPAKTLPEFIAYAKKNPGKLNYGSAGMGAGNHLLTEYLMSVTGISMTHVPFKGDGDVIRELAAGNIDFGITVFPVGAPFVADGRVQGLIVTGTRRMPFLPNVPSLAEDGIEDSLKTYGMYSIFPVLGPPGMPPEVTRVLNEAFTKISRMPEVVHRLEGAQLRAASATPEELTRYITREVTRWSELGKKLDIKF